MPTIDSELKPRLKQSLCTHKILAATAARLYKCDGRRWTLLPNTTGALTLATTKDGSLHVILVSSSTWSAVYSQELYHDFCLVRDNETFYSFEGEDGWMGINFVDAEEASEFARVIDNKAPRQSSKPPGKKLKDGDAAPTSGASSLKGSKSTSTFSRAFSFIKSKVSSSSSRDDTKASPTRKLADLSLEDVGDPTDFRHSAHIGFNAETGAFDVHNVPEEWMAVFKGAGVTERQLRNPETATFIASFVQEQVKQGRSAPPVPAKKRMVGARKAPPPPPTGSRGSAHQGAIIEAQVQSKSATVDPARSQLLASIRGSGGPGVLRKVEASPTKSLTPSSGNDDMSQLLVKALANRNRKLQAEEDSDSEW